MKILYALLIILLFAQIFCGDCDDTNGKDADECNKIGADEGDYRCCYYDIGNDKGCMSISKEDYDGIDDFIEHIEKKESVDVESIDCGSNYIIISLLSLILLFL